MPRKKVTNDYNQTLREQTEIELRSLAKRMNQRLRQLEKSGLTQSSKGYSKLEYWSYKQSKEFLDTTKSGQFKFKTTTRGRTTRQLQAQVRQMKIFEQSHTSTVSGIKKTYKKSYETFKENTGYTGSFSAYTEMMSEDTIQWAKNKYGSERVFLLVNEVGFQKALDIFTLARAWNWSWEEVTLRAFGYDTDITEDEIDDILDIYGESL